MPEAVLQLLGLVVRWLEIIGGSALVFGFVYTTVKWFVEIRRDGAIEAVESYRKALGRAVIIGLEILVAATIIKTITVDPTVESLGLLVFMVAIRTTLGWAMALELNGRWPWQKPTLKGPQSKTAS